MENRINDEIQHEIDHLNGVLYPMRMSNLSKLGYNDTPGDIASDIKKNKNSIILK